MQSMDGPSNDTSAAPAAPVPARSRCSRARGARRGARAMAVVGLGCVGFLAGLAACADAEPPARPAAPVDRAASAPQPALDTASPDTAWLVNVAGARRETAGPVQCPRHVPEALNPPADTTLELAWPASGVQIYACTQAKPGEAPGWALEGPHAVLTAGRAVAAIHFAGPSWQGLDGSSVKGARLASADAPDASAVPWLLMSAAPSGAGTFARTTHIQRLETSGGKAPASGCDAAHLGAKALVPYQANYYFYRTASSGEAIHQCRSERGKAAKP